MTGSGSILIALTCTRIQVREVRGVLSIIYNVDSVKEGRGFRIPSAVPVSDPVSAVVMLEKGQRIRQPLDSTS